MGSYPAKAFLSTLSLRRATAPKGSVHDFKLISIHALLAESDQTQDPQTYHQCQFLSTLSLRRATGAGSWRLVMNLYFYPRSPCGERPPRGRSVLLNTISIHALLAESDAYKGVQYNRGKDFYPRSPCGERHGIVQHT